MAFNSSNSLFDFVVRDGNGVKGLVDSGISEVPQRYIQPPEERINKQDSRPCDAPPIDLSKLNGPEHDQVVDEIARAAETLGFFQVVKHGVPLELLESLKDAALTFFSLPLEKKAVYCTGVSPSPKVKYGTSFVPEKEKALEWKDYISMVYSTDEEAVQYWPNLCKEVALEYLMLSSKMARDILEILIGKLGVRLDDSKIEGLLGMKMVNMNYYPACPNPEFTVGVGRHSDMGTVTVLLQDGIGGLYVKVEEENDAGKGEWLEIPPIPGALVINIGDTLQILSNGKYKSAEHRVRATSTQSRVSVPVFTMPIATERIGPLPEVVKKDGLAHYTEVVFQDYMNNFFGNAHAGKNFNSSNSLYDFVVREGNGVKGVANLGLPEVPERYIQPPEERIKKQDSSTCDAPPIDLSKLNGPEHGKVVDEIVRAAETIGFFQVVNHGVPLELLESLKDAAHAFFSLPAEKKAVYRVGVSPSPMIKLGTSFVTEKEKAWEWKDYISMIYRSDEDALQYWPDQDVVLEYLKLSSKMARDIVEILAGKLGVSPDDSKIEQILGAKAVNMNYYPPCPNPELTVGVGRHSDLGTITVSLQDGIGGLYVKMEEDNAAGKGQWLEIPSIPGALVI
ncbi:Feruloyl CoA ortho-hydroxylase 1 [Spatholobus suberectus]|nr:Feruloyl CoA ortho-hydroxylase 1 [Spatholobus suberectus]